MYSDTPYTVSQAEVIAQRMREKLHDVVQLAPNKDGPREMFDVHSVKVSTSGQLITLWVQSRARAFGKWVQLSTREVERYLIHGKPGQPVPTMETPVVLF